MPRVWTHEDLYEAFTGFGRIKSAKVSIDGDFKSRGYGFVQFDALEAAQEAIKEMHNKEVGKKKEAADASGDEEAPVEIDTMDDEYVSTLNVTEFVPKQDRAGVQQPRCGTNLYVKNFPAEEYSDAELHTRFEAYGEIVSAVVMRDEEGKPRGFGFVCFKDWRDAQKAIDELGLVSRANKESSSDGDEADSTKKRDLYVREAKSKDQR